MRITAALLSVLLFTLPAVRLTAQCSTSNPGGCSCPGGGTSCLLLPDIIAGKRTLNSTTGWSEYGQSAGAPNKGLLRIDVSTPNVGWGPLEAIPTNDYVCGTDTLRNFFPPSGFLCPDGSYPKRLINQRLYQKNGNSFQYVDRVAGWMIYHPSHGHVHIEGWGLYTLRLRGAGMVDTLQFPIVNSGIKVSFCLIDLTTCSGALGDCVDANGNVLSNSSFPNYGLAGGYGCNNVRQGISVGRVDIYSRTLDESFIRIPYEACNGDYFVVVQVDPDNHFREINENNNWLGTQIPLTRQRTANGSPYAYIFSRKGNIVCTGGSIELEASGASSYLWSTGATSQKINVSQPGRYWVRATTPCGATTSDTLDIQQSNLSGHPTVTRTDTICAGERANLYASGNAHWYDAPTGGNLVFIGNSFQTGTLMGNTTFYVTDQPAITTGRIGPPTPRFTGAGHHNSTRSEYLIFNAFLPFKLKTVRLDAFTAGTRTIELRDQYGRLIQQKQVSLVAGAQDVLLDFFVPAGLNHQLGLSSSSPVAALYTSTSTASNIGFPFKLKSVGNIVGSSLGDAAYPFFYNWDVEVTSQACNNAERKPVTVTVVPAPVVSIGGLQASYKHTAPSVKLTGTPSGGSFSGSGVINGHFYPRLAGIGTHIITYTYDNSVCVSQDAKSTAVVLDETALQHGFSVQLFAHPGQPYLWVVTRDYSPLQITFISSSGQMLERFERNVYPGNNFIELDLRRLPRGAYMLSVYHTASGKTQTVKLLHQ